MVRGCRQFTKWTTQYDSKYSILYRFDWKTAEKANFNRKHCSSCAGTSISEKSKTDIGRNPSGWVKSVHGKGGGSSLVLQ